MPYFGAIWIKRSSLFLISGLLMSGRIGRGVQGKKDRNSRRNELSGRLEYKKWTCQWERFLILDSEYKEPTIYEPSNTNATRLRFPVLDSGLMQKYLTYLPISFFNLPILFLHPRI